MYLYSFTRAIQALYSDSFCIFRQPGEESLDVLDKFQALSIATCVLTHAEVCEMTAVRQMCSVISL